ncbi:hypothetical protein EH243_17035 [Amphritea opalescens]|uniref:DUF4136 domain-containing protein n=1 Tax=Amphritea opalescens TaxID=2490544 RepID=A0A430KM36_9GAMM|nr:hypothetical protein [Amphritea opalescens]RTE64524.1 hypothetical protein EH243_17035 [Amphritea opalescens]
MRRITLLSYCLAAALLSGCATNTVQLPEYQGVGGMTQWDIQPEAYLYHYEHGFSGVDALGYDEQLQQVWSRLGAAITCRIDYDKPHMIQLLMQRFGEKAITHELNGIGFHNVQSRKVPQFCSEARINEITVVLQRYKQARFN